MSRGWKPSVYEHESRRCAPSKRKVAGKINEHDRMFRASHVMMLQVARRHLLATEHDDDSQVTMQVMIERNKARLIELHQSTMVCPS